MHRKSTSRDWNSIEYQLCADLPMSFVTITKAFQGGQHSPQAAPTHRARAAGASGGAKPLPTTIFPPFHYKSKEVQYILLNVLRDPLCTHIYDLVHSYSVFRTGEFLGTYVRLIELCTPPQPERGKRRPGPSMQKVRRAINDLVQQGLLMRGEANKAQGQLRLCKTQVKNEATSIRKDNR
jgi:hypothetical protein